MEIGKRLNHVERGAAVRGWRAWVLTETDAGLRLASPLFEQLWLPGEPALASCRRDEDPFAKATPPHGVGSPDCGCGFHAVRDPVDAMSYLRGRDGPHAVGRILGEVTLWGGVLEGDLGWRGTSAYPAVLHTPDAELASALEVYGVTVSSAGCESHSSPTCTGMPLHSAQHSRTSRRTIRI